MHINVLFFATYRDQAQTNKVPLEVPENCTVDQLKKIIKVKFPKVEIHSPSTIVSVNQEFAFNEDVLPDGAEVALFPPVSGGDSDFPTIVSITREKLDIDDLVSKITLPATGATVFFTGMVREVTYKPDYRKIQYLEYEAYQPMAEAKMRQIADEIRQQWPKIQGIAIIQRIGKLEPKIPTVVVACSSAHRNDGIFEAGQYGINRLKEIVPVWKKEAGEEGEVWIEGEYTPSPDKD